MCPHHMCNCVKSATLVAMDKTNTVAVDLRNVCESHDSVVLCSLVVGHMHIIKDLAGGCQSQQEVVDGVCMCMMFRYTTPPIVEGIQSNN